jgi:hypothetical protein
MVGICRAGLSIVSAFVMRFVLALGSYDHHM